MSGNFDIHAAARRAMITNGFQPDVPAAVTVEVSKAAEPTAAVGSAAFDTSAVTAAGTSG